MLPLCCLSARLLSPAVARLWSLSPPSADSLGPVYPALYISGAVSGPDGLRFQRGLACHSRRTEWSDRLCL